ncbi:hypothetical protein FB45DRAFT_1122594 [Roridomyces roridus]|uniref:DUF6534 domain-containing protein n=1 Tax=Roridomyces roridus TaxID=1738132 RepID=A0AAD7FB55_9AGAR|nr:hypothetical protein FB45DRAFT_1122594 [Roridomyces roridus]
MSSQDSLVRFFLGPWLIGGCLELILLGVLCCQFVNYYNWYRDDTRLLKATVLVLCILNLLKSAECFASLWVFFIIHYGDINTALEMSITTWWDTGNPLIVAILNFYVQSYFCTRLWSVCRKGWIVAPIFCIFLFALLAMCVCTYYIKILANEQITNWFAAHLGSVFAGDTLLTTVMAYHLIQNKKVAISPRTSDLVESLIRLTFQTAAPAAVIALCNLVFSQMNRTSRPLLGYVEIAFNQILPKVYAISMMYTLNQRRALRLKMSGSRSGSGTGSDGPSFAVRRPGPTRSNKDDDIELGRIEVQTETTRRVDVTGMFAAPASTHSTHSMEDAKLGLTQEQPS